MPPKISFKKMFRLKTSQEITIARIKRKKEQMEKLKEEIYKMSKLVLREGKLVKVDDVEVETEEVQTPEPMYQQPVQQPVQQPMYQQSGQSFPMPPTTYPQRVQPQQQQLPEVRPVYFRLVEGEEVTAEVPIDRFDEFMSLALGAIQAAGVFQIGNRIINGRYVVYYMF